MCSRDRISSIDIELYSSPLIPPVPPVRRCLINVLGRRIYLLVTPFFHSFCWCGWFLHLGEHRLLWFWDCVLAGSDNHCRDTRGVPVYSGGLAESNPLSISLRHRQPASPLPPITTITRHPVTWVLFVSHCPHPTQWEFRIANPVLCADCDRLSGISNSWPPRPS